MSSRPKKAVKKNQIPKVKKSFTFTKWSKIFAVCAILGAIVWVSYRSMVVPSDINLVESEVSTQKLVTDASGCYYQPVQCVQAPCEPIKVCPSNLSTTTASTIPRECTTWFDGCNTCSVKDGLITSCTRMACEVYQKPYCKISGEEVSIPASTTFPTPSPTSSIIPAQSMSPKSTGIASFKAIKPCVNDGFLSISFICNDGRSKNLASGVCTNIVTAIRTAESTCNEVSQ